jgi:hypothetical protein
MIFLKGKSRSCWTSPLRHESNMKADAHRDDGKRFIVHADEKLTAFLELESVIRTAERPEDYEGLEIKLDGMSRIK